MTNKEIAFKLAGLLKVVDEMQVKGGSDSFILGTMVASLCFLIKEIKKEINNED